MINHVMIKKITDDVYYCVTFSKRLIFRVTKCKGDHGDAFTALTFYPNLINKVVSLVS
jgi:hypothetical protein